MADNVVEFDPSSFQKQMEEVNQLLADIRQIITDGSGEPGELQDKIEQLKRSRKPTPVGIQNFIETMFILGPTKSLEFLLDQRAKLRTLLHNPKVTPKDRAECQEYYDRVNTAISACRGMIGEGKRFLRIHKKHEQKLKREVVPFNKK